jgi:hypothetical protein
LSGPVKTVQSAPERRISLGIDLLGIEIQCYSKIVEYPLEERSGE